MTTEDELKALQAQHDSLKESVERDKKALELKQNMYELSKSRPRPPDTSIGGQMKFLLKKYGLYRSFYLITIGLVMVNIGFLLRGLLPIDAIGILVIGYGIYCIPWVKDFFKDEVIPKVKEEQRRKEINDSF